MGDWTRAQSTGSHMSTLPCCAFPKSTRNTHLLQWVRTEPSQIDWARQSLRHRESSWPRSQGANELVMHAMQVCMHAVLLPVSQDSRRRRAQ